MNLVQRENLTKGYIKMLLFGICIKLQFLFFLMPTGTSSVEMTKIISFRFILSSNLNPQNIPMKCNFLFCTLADLLGLSFQKFRNLTDACSCIRQSSLRHNQI